MDSDFQGFFFLTIADRNEKRERKNGTQNRIQNLSVTVDDAISETQTSKMEQN